MVAVVLSGIIGRFIYIQIPRTIQGRELSLGEIKEMKDTLNQNLKLKYGLDETVYQQLMDTTQQKFEHDNDRFIQRVIRRRRFNAWVKNKMRLMLRQTSLTGKDRRGVMKLINDELSLNAKINRLHTMQTLFKYWHVAHLPFALIMLVIMVIHVAITIAFGYKWIF
jgi:hypothetical protein